MTGVFILLTFGNEAKKFDDLFVGESKVDEGGITEEEEGKRSRLQ
jgi:hypothetical protein